MQLAALCDAQVAGAPCAVMAWLFTCVVPAGSMMLMRALPMSKLPNGSLTCARTNTVAPGKKLPCAAPPLNAALQVVTESTLTTVVAGNSMRELLPGPPLPYGQTVMLLVPALVTVSVNVVPAGNVRASVFGSVKLESVGVVVEFGGVTLLVTVVEKPELEVSVTVTLRAPGLLPLRVSHSPTGIGLAEIEKVCCSAGISVKESGAPLATASVVSVAVLGTTRDSDFTPAALRCR